MGPLGANPVQVAGFLGLGFLLFFPSPLARTSAVLGRGKLFACSSLGYR